MLPLRWSATHNIEWKTPVPGEGFSSPIVWGDRLFVTAALENGMIRLLLCYDRRNGTLLWRREFKHDEPERASSMTGHAASTPATNGRQIVAWFGNAGVVCYNTDGTQLWHRNLGRFDSELGLASSPILFDESVILVCDHDGDRFSSFDSFLIRLDVKTGRVLWKVDRRDLFRSWSTPIVVNDTAGRNELIVNAQGQLRAYDPGNGALLWHVEGMTGWVTPSPVFGHGLIFGTSGRNGPTLAVSPGGRGDVTAAGVIWKHTRGAPYVCSPVLYGNYLYVHDEQGVTACYEARTGKLEHRRRLDGKFIASSVAGDGKLYLTNDAGATYVLQAGTAMKVLARNSLDEYTLASPAIASGALFLRTEHALYCIGPPGSRLNTP